MDIQTRKIEFIQSFLKLQNEEVISQFESLLKKSEKADLGLQQFSIRELNERVAQFEKDFNDNKFKTSSELTKSNKNRN